MNKDFFLVLFSVITIVLAEKPSWYPTDLDAIAKKCLIENHLSPDTKLNLNNNEGIDRSKVYGSFLCMAKAINVYNDETGLSVDRLKFFIKSLSELKCEMTFVQECVDKNPKIASDGEMIFKIFRCMSDMESEMLRNGC